MNIIGLSAHFHDAACCLLRDGTLIAAAQEERFTRRKHDPSIPILALRYCLAEGNLTLPDIDCIAYYEQPRAKFARQLWMAGKNLLGDPALLLRLDPKRAERDIRHMIGFEGEIEYVEHHKAHAASAFYYSGFQDAAILTVDGVGEWTTTAYGQGSKDDIQFIQEVEFPHSLGLLYSAMTSYLGFSVNDGECKVMGLAPYGRPQFVQQIERLVSSVENGNYVLDLKYFDFLSQDRMYSDELPALFGQPSRIPDSEISQFHQDVAQSLQVVLERLLLEQTAHLYGIVPSENLCMAGGVALNCVANSRILSDGPYRRLFVQPAAGDAGAALGAAAIAHHRRTDARRPIARLEHCFLGPAFGSEEICSLLQSGGVDAFDFRGDEDGLLRNTVDLLSTGKVVGWFHGRMEFGPRALGARSILADPRESGMRDRINALVKKRESFRPFAPAVLENKASQHFQLDHPSPFMLETSTVISDLDLPAITHVDRSARVQTVNSTTNPRFARLLEVFESRTGCPILLNTSFNVRGEPIVCDPMDALLCFLQAQLDAVVLGDFLVDRRAVSSACQELIANHLPSIQPAISESVYTMF